MRKEVVGFILCLQVCDSRCVYPLPPIARTCGYFSPSLFKTGGFVTSGIATGKNCSPCHIGVPAKKASAIKMPNGFLLFTAPGFEECVGSLIFITFFLSGLRRVVKPWTYCCSSSL
jgi:hypothetical protein